MAKPAKQSEGSRSDEELLVAMYVAKRIMPELAYWWAWPLLEPFAPLVVAYGEDATITRALANIGDVRNGAAEVLARRFAEHPEEAVARATRIGGLWKP